MSFGQRQICMQIFKEIQFSRLEEEEEERKSIKELNAKLKVYAFTGSENFSYNIGTFQTKICHEPIIKKMYKIDILIYAGKVSIRTRHSITKIGKIARENGSTIRKTIVNI